ncbi:MAG: glycosyltransferase [Candidatus Competibacteraceae bacterium]
MNTPDSAALSVILVTPDRYERIRKTVGYLRAQTIKDRLELIIVAPSVEVLEADESELREFFQFRIVAVGEVRSLPHAMAAGARAASAPVIAFGEDHAFPEPGWAEALLEAHQGPWAAVGPVVRNANPVNWVSWADFLVSYGRWLDPTPAGTVEFLPSHNCSYKRSVLLSYGPQLERMLAVETVLHWDMSNKGHQLYVEPRAKLSHINFEGFSTWIAGQFLNGRLLAASRRENWSPFRRLLYIFGAPLIPVVRLWRVLRDVRRASRQHKLLPGVLPTLIASLVVSGTGEFLGYLLGVSDRAVGQLYHLDFNRRLDEPAPSATDL